MKETKIKAKAPEQHIQTWTYQMGARGMHKEVAHQQAQYKYMKLLCPLQYQRTQDKWLPQPQTEDRGNVGK